MRRITSGRLLDELLASGRLQSSPLRWMEPVVARLEEHWTDRTIRSQASDGSSPLVVAITGVHRGGSWKTPLAVAVAKALAAHGLAGRWIGRGQTIGAGDEVFATRHALRALPIDVEVTRSWAHGLATEASGPRGDFVVLDGCRLRPQQGTGRSLVAVDGALAGSTSWPRSPGLPTGLGLALSPRDRLLVPVVDGIMRAVPETFGATYDLEFEQPIPPAERDHLLLITTHGRPERLVDALARRGLRPRAFLALRDHAGPADVRRGLAKLSRQMPGERFSAVLAADKAALALRDVPLPAPLTLVSCALSLSPALVGELWRAAGKFCR